MHPRTMTINPKDRAAVFSQRLELSVMLFESVITCPHCATKKSEAMPVDACRVFYECGCCGANLRPKQGDCCVFCSYGSVPCPPIQAEYSGEAGPASCCAG
jgi:hypothetical protein